MPRVRQFQSLLPGHLPESVESYKPDSCGDRGRLLEAQLPQLMFIEHPLCPGIVLGAGKVAAV